MQLNPSLQSELEEHFAHFSPGSFAHDEIATISEIPNARKKMEGKITFNSFLIIHDF